MEEVSHKPISLYSGSTVLEGKFVLRARSPNNLSCWYPFIINVNLNMRGTGEKCVVSFSPGVKIVPLSLMVRPELKFRVKGRGLK